jgi:RNA-directed DNA polymerase
LSAIRPIGAATVAGIPQVKKLKQRVADIIVHCCDYKETMRTLESISQRLKEFKSDPNQSKTRIVYCHNSQKPRVPTKVYRSFDFPGYKLKPIIVKVRGITQKGISPGISLKS